MATLQEYYNQLAPIYEPQVASLQAQQAALPAQHQAQKSALEQARINAFRNISNTASARGMAFSGFTPEQEAQYTGTTYMPALANLETQQLKGKQSLIDAINAANADRYAKSLGYYESAQQAEAANAAKIEAARIKAAADLQKQNFGDEDKMLANYWKDMQSGTLGGKKIATKGEELSDPSKYISRESFIQYLRKKYSDYTPSSIASEVYDFYRG